MGETQHFDSDEEQITTGTPDGNAMKRQTCQRVLFNVAIGQLIALGLVSGGIFT